jgi:YVTN family beta-propeller protein
MLVALASAGVALANSNGRGTRPPAPLTPTYAISLVQSAGPPTGINRVRCAAIPGATCNVTGNVRGTGRITRVGQTWRLVVHVPRGTRPGAVPQAVFSTSKGLEAFSCDPIRRLPQSTANCRGTTFVPALQRSRVTIVFGPASHVYGLNMGPVNTNVYATSGDVFSPPGDVTPIDPATHTPSAPVPVGSEPTGVALNGDGSRIYVTNRDSSSVSVLDAENNLVATIPVGDNPVGVAVNPVLPRAYVANASTYVANASIGTVSVIDTDLNTVIQTITVGSGLLGSVAVSPDGKRVYVAHTIDGGVSEVVVINAALNTNVLSGNNMQVGVNSVIADIALNPTGTRLYASALTGITTIFDTATNAAVAALPFGGGGIAFGADGTRAYVGTGETVEVLDTTLAEQTPFPAAAITATVTLPLGGNASSLAYSAPDNSVYVAGSVAGFANPVTVIDAAAPLNQPLEIQPVPEWDGTVATLPLPPPPGAFAYVTESDKLDVIDAVSGDLVGSAPAPGYTAGIAITPDGNKAYVATGGHILLFDITGVVPTLIPTNLPAGPDPRGIAISPDGLRVYVADYDTGDVLVINTTSNTELPPVHLGFPNDPWAVAAGNNNRVYVVNAESTSFSVIDTTNDDDTLVELPPNNLTSTPLNPPGGTGVAGIAITPDGTRAYITTGGGLMSVATDTNALDPTILATGTGFSGITFGNVPGLGARGYLAESNADKIAVLDPNSIPPAIVDTFALAASPDPSGLAVNPLGTRLHVASPAGTLAVLTTNPLAALSNTSGLGSNVFYVAVRP